MNNRKYKTPPEKLLDEGKKILAGTEQSRYYLKVCAINLVLSGSKASFVASMMGFSRMSVSDWVKTADEKGFSALKEEKRPGRPGRLSDGQRKAIDKALQESPAASGLKVWDGPGLAAFISRTFGVGMGVRQCQRLMHSLGYSLIRPQSFPSKGRENTEAREEFRRRRDEISQDPSLVAVCQDEVHFQVQTTVTSSWFRKGSEPKVKSLPGRSKVSYSGFVVPSDGRLFVSSPERFTYSTTLESIRAFLAANPPPENKRYAIFIDNAPWHRKAFRLVETECAEEYADIREKALLVRLPPYSPDLNPIEQVWRITRRENTHNVFFSSVSELKEKVDAAFSLWSRPNQQLMSLCSFK